VSKHWRQVALTLRNLLTHSVIQQWIPYSTEECRWGTHLPWLGYKMDTMPSHILSRPVTWSDQEATQSSHSHTKWIDQLTVKAMRPLLWILRDKPMSRMASDSKVQVSFTLMITMTMNNRVSNRWPVLCRKGTELTYVASYVNVNVKLSVLKCPK